LSFYLLSVKDDSIHASLATQLPKRSGSNAGLRAGR
jgi:hypothetical protein